MVAVILVATIAVLVNFNVHRVGLLPLSEVNAAAGQNLVESNIGHSYVYSSYVTPVKLEAAFFNNSSGSGFIEVVSIEWNNQSQSKYVYNVVYEDLVLNLGQNLTPKSIKGSFDGFNYNWALLNKGNYYVFISAGYSGKYSFFIYDLGIKISNPTDFVQEELSAMSGMAL